MKLKCKMMGIQHFEVSAKTGQNVKELFISVIEAIEEKLSRPILPEDTIIETNEEGMKTQGEMENEEQTSSFAVKLSPHPQKITSLGD